MEFLGPKDIAGELGISERAVTRLMEEGTLRAMRAGKKKWRTTRLHFESYVAAAFEQERLRHETPASGPGLVIGKPKKVA